MARILVCHAQVPYAAGGAERYVANLVRELKKRGHRVDIVALPLKDYPREQILWSALAWRLIDVTDFDGAGVDVVIATKYPSYLVRHHNKIVWLVHQFRQVYDQYGQAPLSDFLGRPDDIIWRRRVMDADAAGLGEARHRFAISRNVAARLHCFNQMDAEVLYHPPPLASHVRTTRRTSGFALAVSRLVATKRIHLTIEASARGKFPLIVVGEGPDGKRLRKLADDLRAPVTFTGAIPDDELIRLYDACSAVLYTPIDEDYGYVTLEAFHSAKPVVTCTDSGGSLEFVENQVTGHVVEPDPAALADATREILRCPRRAKELGQEGRRRAALITWDSACERLLAAGGVS